MSRIRGLNTKPEITLRSALSKVRLRFRLRSKIAGRPDIVFVSAKVAVFVDGCFWHKCPEHCRMPVSNRSFWKKKLLKNFQRDRNVDLILKAEGWLVVRVWEHEIKDDLVKVVSAIKKRVKRRKISAL